MGLERLLLTAGTIAFLAGAANAQKSWQSLEPYRTKEGKDTTVLFTYTQVGNDVNRINTYTRQAERVVDGLVLSSNPSFERGPGNYVFKNYKDGSSVSGAVFSNKNVADAKEEQMKRYREYLQAQNQTPEKLYELAQLRYKEGNYESAKGLLEKAIAKDSTKAEYFNLLGDSYYNLKNPNDALRCYKRCVSLNPKDGNGWKGVGGVCWDLNRRKEALEAWKKGLNFDEGCRINYEWGKDNINK